MPTDPPTNVPTNLPTNLPTDPPGRRTGPERRRSRPTAGPERRRSLLTRWGRLLDGLRPSSDADRLVRVADVGRGTLPLAEGSLADLALAPVVRETRTTTGETRFSVLVPARNAEAAREALSGL